MKNYLNTWPYSFLKSEFHGIFLIFKQVTTEHDLLFGLDICAYLTGSRDQILNNEKI